MKKSIVENSRASRGPSIPKLITNSAHAVTLLPRPCINIVSGVTGSTGSHRESVPSRPVPVVCPLRILVWQPMEWATRGRRGGLSSRASRARGCSPSIVVVGAGPNAVSSSECNSSRIAWLQNRRRTEDRAAPYRTVALRTRLSSSNERRLSRPRFASVGLDPGYRVCVFLHSHSGPNSNIA